MGPGSVTSGRPLVDLQGLIILSGSSYQVFSNWLVESLEAH